MGNELESNKVCYTRETNAGEVRKKWNTPQLTSVSIAELTEHNLSTGSDGAATSTLS